jgi:hypothetical protein
MANSYFGLTGKTSLNEDGDRRYGTYDFWIINEKDDNKGYGWVKVKNSTSIQLNTKMNYLDTGFSYHVIRNRDTEPWIQEATLFGWFEIKLFWLVELIMSVTILL